MQRKNGNEMAERNASLNNLFLGRLGIFGCLNKSRGSYKMYVVSVPMKRYSAFRVLLTSQKKGKGNTKEKY